MRPGRGPPVGDGRFLFANRRVVRFGPQHSVCKGRCLGAWLGRTRTAGTVVQESSGAAGPHPGEPSFLLDGIADPQKKSRNESRIPSSSTVIRRDGKQLLLTFFQTGNAAPVSRLGGLAETLLPIEPHGAPRSDPQIPPLRVETRGTQSGSSLCVCGRRMTLAGISLVSGIEQTVEIRATRASTMWYILRDLPPTHPMRSSLRPRQPAKTK